MKILQVVHDFLPNHLAGVEIYTDLVSRYLTADHEVGILYSEVVPEAPNYSLRRGRHGRVRTFELVNNHRFESFEETYVNHEVDRRVREVLDELEPDVIHVQHLLNLSLNLVGEAHRRGIPVMMTLHDHWLTCANGGQRFHRVLGRCEALDADRCGRCMATVRGLVDDGGTNGSQGMLHQLSRLGRNRRIPLVEQSPAGREAPEPSYIYLDNYRFDGEMRPTWVAHPPARLRFQVSTAHDSSFVSAIGLHPQTFDREGGGVRFAVRVDGEERFSRVLDPKRRIEDRVPLPFQIPLPGGDRQLELCTEAVPETDHAFCTAGWIDPHVTIPESAGSSALQRLAGRGRRLAAWPENRRRRRRIRERWQAVRAMASQVDLFIAPSRYLRDELVRFGFDRDKVLYSDYGFVTDGFERRQAPERARRFAFIGSLVRHKGLHVLLEAFRDLPPELELRVCGAFDYDPEYFAALRARPNHPGVDFLGQVDNDKIPAFLADVDCLIVPSIWTENSPLTIHEAFLAGVPVVASRLGGHLDLLAEGGGLLYDADDPEDLARQLRRLHSEKGLLRELAAGIPEVKPMDRHVDELVGIYERLLTGQRPDG